MKREKEIRVRMALETYKKLKVKAILDNKQVNDIVLEALKTYLK